MAVCHLFRAPDAKVLEFTQGLPKAWDKNHLCSGEAAFWREPPLGRSPRDPPIGPPGVLALGPPRGHPRGNPRGHPGGRYGGLFGGLFWKQFWG